jgi:hypothetical protein
MGTLPLFSAGSVREKEEGFSVTWGRKQQGQEGEGEKEEREEKEKEGKEKKNMENKFKLENFWKIKDNLWSWSKIIFVQKNYMSSFK